MLTLRPLIQLFLVAALSLPGLARAATPLQERDECMRNLQAINQSIQKFRKDKKDVPTWLSDLVPDYLDDPNLLVCPEIGRAHV